MATKKTTDTDQRLQRLKRTVRRLLIPAVRRVERAVTEALDYDNAQQRRHGDRILADLQRIHMVVNELSDHVEDTRGELSLAASAYLDAARCEFSSRMDCDEPATWCASVAIDGAAINSYFCDAHKRECQRFNESKIARTHHDGLSGDEIVTMTQECVNDCSASGTCDAAVEYWVGRVIWHAADAALRRSLRECGAWDDLSTASTEMLRERALWVGACELSEEAGDRQIDESVIYTRIGGAK